MSRKADPPGSSKVDEYEQAMRALFKLEVSGGSCEYCDKSKDLKVCSGCRTVSYCSEQCRECVLQLLLSYGHSADQAIAVTGKNTRHCVERVRKAASDIYVVSEMGMAEAKVGFVFRSARHNCRAVFLGNP